MDRSIMRPLILSAVFLAAGLALWFAPLRAPDGDTARLTWVADAHQFGPVGYRDPAGALSPDGRWIAYSEGRFLRVRAVEGGPLVEFPAGEAQIRNIVWDSESQRIVADGFETQTGWAIYDRVTESRRGLWANRDPLLARLGDSGTATTTAKVSDLRQLAWSPTGRIIAGIVNGREGQELWTLTADGAAAEAHRFTHRIAFPAFTAKGDIACVATVDGRSRVTVPCGGAAITTDPDLDVYGPVAFTRDDVCDAGERLWHAGSLGGAHHRRAGASPDVVLARHLRSIDCGRRQRGLQSPELPHHRGDGACCRRTQPAARDISKRDAVVGSDRPPARDHLRHMAARRGRCALSGYRAGHGDHRGEPGDAGGEAVTRRSRVGVGGSVPVLVAERQVDCVPFAQGSVGRHLAAACDGRHAAAPHQLSGPGSRGRLAAVVS